VTTLIIIAKETLPGRVKTRLHPPLSLEQAAELAAASVADTLETLAALPADRHILLFDGVNPPPNSENFEIIPQSAGDLDERLASIFDLVSGRTLLVGMDTPQITAAHLAPIFDPSPSVDAWFGPAYDGGFWALGMEEPRGDLIRGVPMSRDDTGAIQLARLHRAGLRVKVLPSLTDVDTIDSALEVAFDAPSSRFARTLNKFAITEGTTA